MGFRLSRTQVIYVFLVDKPENYFNFYCGLEGYMRYNAKRLQNRSSEAFLSTPQSKTEEAFLRAS
jgi:hypothetical protein